MLNTKVLVVYHTNAPLRHDKFMDQYPDVFVPILGGGVYYQKGSSLSIDMIAHDNMGENISEYNRQINEHTVLYWMYHHYDLLGNPDMVGLCHYRRCLEIDYDHLDKSKIYALKINAVHKDVKPVVSTVYELYSFFLTQPLLEVVLGEYRAQFPSYEQDLNIVLESCRFYGKNLMVLSRENFFSYAEYIISCYRLLFDKDLNEKIKEMFDAQSYPAFLYFGYRAKSYLCELFTAVWLNRQERLFHNVIQSHLTESSFVDDKVR